MFSTEFYATDFKFGDKCLSDFGGTIINKDGWSLKNQITIERKEMEIPKRDGCILVNWKYSSRIIEMSVFIDEDIELDEFSAWLLNGEQKLSFIEDGREINAILDNSLDIKSYFNKHFRGMLDLTFVACSPYWRLIKEKTVKKDNPSLNETIFIKTKGNRDSLPIIMITPNGSQSKLRFEWNGHIVVLTDIANKTVYIDGERGKMYYMTNGSEGENITYKYYYNEFYDFPTLKAGIKNTFKLIEGSITKLEINPRSIFI